MSTTTDQLENDIMAIDIRLNELRRIRELKVQELKEAVEQEKQVINY